MTYSMLRQAPLTHAHTHALTHTTHAHTHCQAFKCNLISQLGNQVFYHEFRHNIIAMHKILRNSIQLTEIMQPTNR